jgi:hypothetical protein
MRHIMSTFSKNDIETSAIPLIPCETWLQSQRILYSTLFDSALEAKSVLEAKSALEVKPA